MVLVPAALLPVPVAQCLLRPEWWVWVALPCLLALALAAPVDLRLPVPMLLPQPPPAFSSLSNWPSFKALIPMRWSSL